MIIDVMFPPSACPSSSLSPHVESIWSLLFQNVECPEEGTRNLVAECLGKLTLGNGAKLLPRIQKHLNARTTRDHDSVCVYVCVCVCVFVRPSAAAGQTLFPVSPQVLLWLAARW